MHPSPKFLVLARTLRNVAAALVLVALVLEQEAAR